MPSTSKTDSSLLSLLTGGENHQSNILANHRGFLLTNGLANQIIDMNSGDQVTIITAFIM